MSHLFVEGLLALLHVFGRGTEQLRVWHVDTQALGQDFEGELLRIEGLPIAVDLCTTALSE